MQINTDAADSTIEQQVGFGSNEAGDVTAQTSTVDQTYKAADVSAGLGSFLQRPVRIANYEWEWETAFEQRMNPWVLFLSTPTIKKKLDNFAAIRGVLHVKFQISGSPFYSGKLMASYLPMHQWDSQWDQAVSNAYAPIRESQRIRGFLDPTLNEGCEIVCPFYWPKNALSLTLDDEPNFMGEITLRDIALLRSVTSQKDAVHITAYAWMSDFSFVGQTFLESTIQMECTTPSGGGTEQDIPGPISKIASSVQRVSGALSKVPVIGEYALATNLAARGVGEAAKAFGLSRPTNIDPVQRIAPFSSDNTAVATDKDLSYKLAIDPRNELTIDPNVAGFDDDDELSIKSFTARESYLTKTTWAKDSPNTVPLFQCAVSPLLFDHDVANGGIHFTPVGYAANMFGYWRGSIDFRIMVNSSAFHKGKLKLSYDAVPQATTTANYESYDTAENYILDISEARDTTFRVSWASATSWKVLTPNYTDPTRLRFSTNSVVTDAAAYEREMQGMFTITIANDLQAPQDTAATDSEIDICIFVKAGPDFQLAVPTERFSSTAMMGPTEAIPNPAQLQPPKLPTPKKKKGGNTQQKKVRTQVQASVEPTALTDCNPDVVDEICHTFGETISTTDHLPQVFFGEDIVSLTQLMKRYSLNAVWSHSTANFATNARGMMHKIWMPAYPRPRGAIPEYTQDIFHSCSSINLIASCFLAVRGSIRTRIMVINTGHPVRDTESHPKARTQACVTNVFQPAGLTQYLETITSLEDSNVGRARSIADNIDTMAAGGVWFDTTHNSVVAFESPYYSPLRFYPGKSQTRVVERTIKGLEPVFSMVVWSEIGTNDYCIYKAAGEDFSCQGFAGVPIIYEGAPI